MPMWTLFVFSVVFDLCGTDVCLLAKLCFKDHQIYLIELLAILRGKRETICKYSSYLFLALQEFINFSLSFLGLCNQPHAMVLHRFTCTYTRKHLFLRAFWYCWLVIHIFQCIELYLRLVYLVIFVIWFRSRKN